MHLEASQNREKLKIATFPKIAKGTSSKFQIISCELKQFPSRSEQLEQVDSFFCATTMASQPQTTSLILKDILDFLDKITTERFSLRVNFEKVDESSKSPPDTSWLAELEEKTYVTSYHEFPIQNLPYGVFQASVESEAHIGVAIRDYILDLTLLSKEGLFQGTEHLDDGKCFQQTTLNAFMALG